MSSVLAEIAALKTAEFPVGRMWFRVRLLSTPATVQASLALKLAAGIGEKAQKPEGRVQGQTKAVLEKVIAAHAVIICEALEAVAMMGPDGKPVQWQECKVVPLEADEDPANNVLSVQGLDKIQPGLTTVLVGVAMHDLVEEAGVLRPFSAIMPSSSA